MTISANYPSINPSLLLDFANSVALDPRVSLIRAGTGTYYDGSTSAVAEQNFFLYSQTLGNAAWVSTNNTITTSITDPASGTTAQTLTASAGNSTFYQTVTLTATAYTVSFYVQRVTGTGTINFTLDGTNFTAITAPTGSWVRYSITATPTAGAKTVGIQIVTSGDAINIAFGQLENRSGASGYIATATAAVTNYISQLLTAVANQPRFDFNPTTRQSLGLLIEEQKTNVVTYSQAFDNAAWGKTNVTIIPSANIAPDGTLTASLMTNNSTNGEHNFSAGPFSTAIRTLSIYAKAGSASFLGLSIYGLSTRCAVFDLGTGAVSSVVGGYASITSVGNGWYRCSFHDPGGLNYCVVYMGETAAQAVAQTSYIGTNKNIYVWGAQHENGSFPTSYIKTDASSVTRAQDYIAIGTSSWFNNNQCTIYCSFDTASVGTNSPSMTYWSIENGTSLGYYANKASGSSTLTVFQGSASASAGTISAIPTGSLYTAKQQNAYSYNNTSGSLAASGLLNGGSVGTITPAPISFTPTACLLGRQISITNPMTGHICKFAYYPIATTTAQMQALTGS